MKINWGTGITIAIIAFMSFILLMVFKMTSTDADLYAKDYYNQEISYQTRIDAKSNTNKLSGRFNIQLNDKNVTVNFPNDFKEQVVSGHIKLYRPNNADRDTQYSINLTDNSQSLDLTELLLGHYDLKIECENKGMKYYYEQPLVLR